MGGNFKNRDQWVSTPSHTHEHIYALEVALLARSLEKYLLMKNSHEVSFLRNFKWLNVTKLSQINRQRNSREAMYKER